MALDGEPQAPELAEDDRALLLDRRRGRAGVVVDVVDVAAAVIGIRPVYAKLNTQLDRYQQVIEPLRRLVMIGVPALIGLFAAVSIAEESYALRRMRILFWAGAT